MADQLAWLQNANLDLRLERNALRFKLREANTKLDELRDRQELMEKLLLKIGWVLEQPCWRTYGALATLRNDINDMLGVE